MDNSKNNQKKLKQLFALLDEMEAVLGQSIDSLFCPKQETTER